MHWVCAKSIKYFAEHLVNHFCKIFFSQHWLSFVKEEEGFSTHFGKWKDTLMGSTKPTVGLHVARALPV
jgi:hypothetical protein